MVMTTEMMEHLPESAYAIAVNEVMRVADKYVLITVPNREDLEEHMVLCPACGSRFHVWGHRHSYFLKLLETLFSGFKPLQVFTFGSCVATYNRLLLWVRTHVAGASYWEPHTVCYYCRETKHPAPRWRLWARLCDFLNARLRAPFFKRRSWLLGVYARREDN